MKFLLFLLLILAAPLAAQQPPTIAILVRHAEKAPVPTDDPPLSNAGRARATAPAVIARDAGVTAIITTQFVRSKETARPAAESLGIAPEVARAGGPDHVSEVARLVRAHAGGVVLVVGHSNTIPAIAAALGARQPAAICDSEYDGLYVVVLEPEGRPSHLVSARYGEPSPRSASCGAMRP